MTEVIGHVDERERPLLSLSLPGTEDDLLVILDTGFNGQLLIHENAAFRFAYESKGVDVWVEFADGVRRTLQLATSSIVWFGRKRTVDLWIAKTAPRRASSSDEPVGLIGTGLISPHMLMIDFAKRRIVIREYPGYSGAS